MENKFIVYKKIFTSTFQISAFTFGGGYVIIPLLKKKFVDELNWIEEDEMLNLAAIAQASPGAVAVNGSIMVGYHIAGAMGAFIAIIGTILPPMIIISLISLAYEAFRDHVVVNAVLKGMQAGVAAVVVDVVLHLASGVLKLRDWVSNSVMILSFIAVYFLQINVMYIILFSGLIGALRIVFLEEKRKREAQ